MGFWGDYFLQWCLNANGFRIYGSRGVIIIIIFIMLECFQGWGLNLQDFRVGCWVLSFLNWWFRIFVGPWVSDPSEGLNFCGFNALSSAYVYWWFAGWGFARGKFFLFFFKCCQWNFIVYRRIYELLVSLIFCVLS